jgi:hypothetical protein
MCRQGVLGSGSGAGQNRNNRAVTVTKRIRNHDYGPDATLATCAIRFEVCIKDISTVNSVFHNNFSFVNIKIDYMENLNFFHF